MFCQIVKAYKNKKAKKQKSNKDKSFFIAFLLLNVFLY